MTNQKSIDTLPGKLLFSVNIAKNTLGSFMIFLPWVLNKTGLVLGFLLLFMVYIVSVYTFVLVGYLGKKADVNSYSKMFNSVGKPAVFVVDFSIMALTLLGNAGYIMFVKGRLSELIMIIGNYDEEPISKTLLAVIYTFVFLLPLSIPKRLHKLRFLSFMAFSATIIMIGLIIYYFAITDRTNVKINAFPTGIVDFVVAFSIFAGNFDCHTNALEYYIEYCKHSTKKSFKVYTRLIFLAMAMVLVVTSVFSTFCYLAIGENITDDPIKLINHKTVKILLSCSLIISLTITYAQFINPIRNSLHTIFFETILKRNYPMTKKARYLETFIIVVITMIIGILFDDIGYFNACVWSVFGSMILFVFPTALAMKMGVLKTIWGNGFNAGVLFYGIVISCLLGLITTIYSWAK